MLGGHGSTIIRLESRHGSLPIRLERNDRHHTACKRRQRTARQMGSALRMECLWNLSNTTCDIKASPVDRLCENESDMRQMAH